MRPPKSVRDRLKKKGLWFNTKTPPPAFSAFKDVEDIGTNPIPIPGAFTPVFNSFQARDELPSIAISVHDPFYEIAEMLDIILLENDVSREKLRSMGLTCEVLVSRLLGAGCISLCGRLTGTHANMGNQERHEYHTEPVLPMTIAEYIHRIGPFIGPDSRRWELSCYDSHIMALSRCAYLGIVKGDFRVASVQSWLPCGTEDGRTKHIVGCRLQNWFRDRGFYPDFPRMVSCIFSGELPPDIAASVSHVPFLDRCMVERLFQIYSTEQQFVEMFQDEIGTRALDSLGLTWIVPEQSDLGFSFDFTSTANWILSSWQSIAGTFERLYGVRLFRTVYKHIRGLKSQVAHVSGDDGEWRVDSPYFLTGDEMTEAVILGSPVISEYVPFSHQADGRVQAHAELRSLLEYDLGF